MPLRSNPPVRSLHSVPEPFGSVAWRAPSANRFDGRAANDLAADRRLAESRSLGEELANLPGWAVAVGGAFLAAGMGALLGGALHI